MPRHAPTLVASFLALAQLAPAAARADPPERTYYFVFERVAVGPLAHDDPPPPRPRSHPERVRATVRAHHADLALCAAANGALDGTVVVYFVIEPSGRVSDATLTFSSMPASVGGCVVGVLRAWTFPAPPGGSRVVASLPIAFHSR